MTKHKKPFSETRIGKILRRLGLCVFRCTIAEELDAQKKVNAKLTFLIRQHGIEKKDLSRHIGVDESLLFEEDGRSV